MTAILTRRGGSQILLSEAEVESLTPLLNDPNVRFITIQSITMRKDLIDDIATARELSCTKCGENFIEGSYHSCVYKGVDALVDGRGKHSLGLEKLRVQVTLMRKGVPSRQAYFQAWGRELRSAAAYE